MELITAACDSWHDPYSQLLSPRGHDAHLDPVVTGAMRSAGTSNTYSDMQSDCTNNVQLTE